MRTSDVRGAAVRVQNHRQRRSPARRSPRAFDTPFFAVLYKREPAQPPTGRDGRGPSTPLKAAALSAAARYRPRDGPRLRRVPLYGSATTATMEALAMAAVLLLVLRTAGRVGPAGNVDIGRGVDVLQRFGIIGDVLYGDVSSTKEMVTHDIIDGADRYT